MKLDTCGVGDRPGEQWRGRQRGQGPLNGRGTLALACMTHPAGSGMTMLGRRSRCPTIATVIFKLVHKMNEKPARYLEEVMRV